LIKKAFKKQIEREISSKLDSVSKAILSDLKEVTPKDTGAAANSWEVTNLDKEKLSFEINNDKDYIKYLNAGSSQQAPANFIERIYFVGKVESLLTTPARDDAMTATVALSIQSDFYGPFTVTATT